MLDLQTILIFAAVFVAGAVLATVLYVIGYMSSRKGTADELDDRGFVGRRKP